MSFSLLDNYSAGASLVNSLMAVSRARRLDLDAGRILVPPNQFNLCEVLTISLR